MCSKDASPSCCLAIWQSRTPASKAKKDGIHKSYIQDRERSSCGLGLSLERTLVVQETRACVAYSSSPSLRYQ
jgi:hypothetical protein